MKGQLYDRMGRQDVRLTGQNVRGLTSQKLAKVCQFKKASLLQRSRHLHTSAFHSRTRPRPAYSSDASRAPTHTYALFHVFDSRATHARTLLPAALASVPFGFVLVRVRVRVRVPPGHWLVQRPSSSSNCATIYASRRGSLCSKLGYYDSAFQLLLDLPSAVPISFDYGKL